MVCSRGIGVITLYRQSKVCQCRQLVRLGVRILGRKEGKVLFNDALNTFYFWLHGTGHMVTDHSDNERGNLLLPHGLLFLLAARVLLYASSHR